MPLHEALHATRILTGVRLRRASNMMAVGTFRRFRAAGTQTGAKREATPRRASTGWLLMTGVAVMMSLSIGSIFREFLLTLYCHYAPICVGHASVVAGVSRLFPHAMPVYDGMLRGLTILASMLWIFAVLYPFALAVRTGPDWDMEWLATLPMSKTTLLCARIAERAIVNPIAWFSFGIMGAVVAWHAHPAWLTPLYLLFIVPPLLLLTSSAWTALDMGLHVALTPKALRNLQAVLGLALAPVIYLMTSLGSPTGRHYTLMLADRTPAWTLWTPPGVAVQILCAPFTLNTLGLYGLFLLEVGVAILLSLGFLRWQLRAGLVTHGARESGRATESGKRSRGQRSPALQSWLSPVKRRELTLLLRDRRYLVQYLGMPLVLAGGQWLINGHLGDVIAQNPGFVSSAAFGIGSYTLILSAMVTLGAEGDRLWLLYTFPRSIASILLEKTQLHTLIALFYPLLLFFICISLSKLAPWHYAVGFVLVVVGLALYGVIALSLGVLSGVPAGSGSREIGVRYVYLFMSLAAFYVYALLSSAWWPRLTTPILCAALAYALWQKANDRLPYLLDPTAAPPSRVSLADGLVAAMLFFVLQFFAGYALGKLLDVGGGTRVLLGYVCAGAITYVSMRCEFWMMKTRSVPRVFGPRPLNSAVFGAAVGLICGSAALVYLWFARHYDFAPNNGSFRALGLDARITIAVLVVCAAPVFEEFLFRGLIFGGLRRSLNTALSTFASAALFAIVHPPFSMAPVFVLGIGTAWAYQRRRILLAPMMTHAVYNAVVVGYQLAMYHT